MTSTNFDNSFMKGSTKYVNDFSATKHRVKEIIEHLRENHTGIHMAEKEIDEVSATEEIYKAAADFRNTGSFKEQKVLAGALEKYGFFLHCYDYYPTSVEKKRVARMAFNGCVEKPKENDLSPDFRKLKNLQIKRETHSAEEYDLNMSPAWQIFKQVPEFANIESQARSACANFGVPVSMLSSLSVHDFCHLINEKFRSSNGTNAKIFPESYKAKNTKRFIAENEDAFRFGMLQKKGINKEYVETLIRAMKQGYTDLTKYNENGSPVWKKEWSNQPVIDVHHIVNIKDASNKETNGKSFASVNDYENMCFIVRDQHDIMHALENDMKTEAIYNDIFFNRRIDKKYIYRIQPPENVKCILGFDFQIYDKSYLEKNNIRVNEYNMPADSAEQAKIDRINQEKLQKYKEAKSTGYNPKYKSAKGNYE